LSSALLSPEEETFPNRIRWTVEECYRLKDLGFLHGRFEVLDGEVVNKMGQNPPHAFAITQLGIWANRAFGEEFVRIQLPIALDRPDSEYSEPEPDVVVTCMETSAFAGRHPRPEDIILIAEVADSSLRTDLIVKARLYARAGIPEYWALDLQLRRLHVHRDPANGKYGFVSILAESEAVTHPRQADAGLSVSFLLAPADSQ
jgi:Uma2 family endonuclease